MITGQIIIEATDSPLTVAEKICSAKYYSKSEDPINKLISRLNGGDDDGYYRDMFNYEEIEKIANHLLIEIGQRENNGGVS